MPEFEHDFLKSVGNLWKHGISLAEAEKLWLDPRKLYQPISRVYVEPRYKVIARHEGKIWTCVFTLRQGRLRLITCRRALITAEEFDRRFDAGEDMHAYCGPSMNSAQFRRYLLKQGVKVPAGL